MENKIEKDNLVSCRNCKSDVKNSTSRCPYCGILNPTVTISQVLKTTFIVIVVMYIYSIYQG